MNIPQKHNSTKMGGSENFDHKFFFRKNPKIFKVENIQGNSVKATERFKIDP
jgi:hypothetical protein